MALRKVFDLPGDLDGVTDQLAALVHLQFVDALESLAG
jgi:hypothetical protein